MIRLPNLKSDPKVKIIEEQEEEKVHKEDGQRNEEDA